MNSLNRNHAVCVKDEVEARKRGRGPIFFFFSMTFFLYFFFRTNEVSLSNEQMAFLVPSELSLSSRVM